MRGNHWRALCSWGRPREPLLSLLLSLSFLIPEISWLSQEASEVRGCKVAQWKPNEVKCSLAFSLRHWSQKHLTSTFVLYVTSQNFFEERSNNIDRWNIHWNFAIQIQGRLLFAIALPFTVNRFLVLRTVANPSVIFSWRSQDCCLPGQDGLAQFHQILPPFWRCLRWLIFNQLLSNRRPITTVASYETSFGVMHSHIRSKYPRYCRKYLSQTQIPSLMEWSNCKRHLLKRRFLNLKHL